MSTRVIVVDAYAAARTGLTTLLDAEHDIEVVGEAASPERAIFLARSLDPEVVVMDVDRTGLEAIRHVLEQNRTARIIVLSMQDDPRSARDAIDSGASGYVRKQAVAELGAAIREVAGGGRHVDPALGARVIEAELEERRRAAADPLTEREREVLRLLALGYTNQEVAQALVVSVRTIETHRAHIMQKLGLSTRADLVRYALGHGVLDADRTENALG
jgi:two-component system, NarL family, response regulator NreC